MLMLLFQELELRLLFMVVQLFDNLKMMGVFTIVSSDAILRSRDKLRSLQRLSKAGIGMPKTVFTNYSTRC